MDLPGGPDGPRQSSSSNLKISEANKTTTTAKDGSSKVAENISALLAAEARELAMLNEIRNTITKEENNIKRVKADNVEEAFHRIADLLNLVLTERSGLKKARRAIIETVKANHSGHIVSNDLSMVSESLARQETAFQAQAAKLEKMENMFYAQTEVVETLKNQVVKMNGNIQAAENKPQSEWSEIVRRRPKEKPRVIDEHLKVVAREKAPKLSKTKKPGILIKAAKEDFPALARRIRSAPNISAGESKIVAMRRIRAGASARGRHSQ